MDVERDSNGRTCPPSSPCVDSSQTPKPSLRVAFREGQGQPRASFCNPHLRGLPTSAAATLAGILPRVGLCTDLPLLTSSSGAVATISPILEMRKSSPERLSDLEGHKAS